MLYNKNLKKFKQKSIVKLVNILIRKKRNVMELGKSVLNTMKKTRTCFDPITKLPIKF